MTWHGMERESRSAAQTVSSKARFGVLLGLSASLLRWCSPFVFWSSCLSWLQAEDWADVSTGRHMRIRLRKHKSLTSDLFSLRKFGGLNGHRIWALAFVLASFSRAFPAEIASAVGKNHPHRSSTIYFTPQIQEFPSLPPRPGAFSIPPLVSSPTHAPLLVPSLTRKPGWSGNSGGQELTTRQESSAAMLIPRCRTLHA